MGLKEEWKQLKGHTKMMVIGGGGVALFFLYTAIKNRNTQATQATQQDTSSGASPDYSSALDQMTSQMQQMQQAEQQQIQQMQDANNQQQQANQQTIQQFQQSFKDLMNQNQQNTQNQISDLLNKYGALKTSLTKKPTTPPPAAYAHPIKGPTHPVTTAPKPSPVVKANPIKGPTHPVNPFSSVLQKAGHFATPKGGWNSSSVVDLLKANGDNSSLVARKQLAVKAGIKNYTGTASQNTALKNSLQKAGLKY